MQPLVRCRVTHCRVAKHHINASAIKHSVPLRGGFKKKRFLFGASSPYLHLPGCKQSVDCLAQPVSPVQLPRPLSAPQERDAEVSPFMNSDFTRSHRRNAATLPILQCISHFLLARQKCSKDNRGLETWEGREGKGLGDVISVILNQYQIPHPLALIH